jgi:hypothetical protein
VSSSAATTHVFPAFRALTFVRWPPIVARAIAVSRLAHPQTRAMAAPD